MKLDPNYRIPPGETLKETLLAMSYSHNWAAFILHLTSHEFRRLLAGTLPITSALANDLERLTGVRAKFWLRLERAYRKPLSKKAP